MTERDRVMRTQGSMWAAIGILFIFVFGGLAYLLISTIEFGITVKASTIMLTWLFIGIAALPTFFLMYGGRFHIWRFIVHTSENYTPRERKVLRHRVLRGGS